tara:strand:+ start:1110 stop:1304 length:195 start_codon:yes stop_codon:yes gene_type:complete
MNKIEQTNEGFPEMKKNVNQTIKILKKMQKDDNFNNVYLDINTMWELIHLFEDVLYIIKKDEDY